MKATDLLKKQHRIVDDLFARFEKADTTQDKIDIFNELAANLVGHDAIEREIFYPACEKVVGKDEDAKDDLTEAIVEHGLVEFCLVRAQQHQRKDAFDSYVKVLKEAVQHHVEEEEKEFFPEVEKKLADQDEALTPMMEARFAKAMKEDWRKAVMNNLKQVLDGATKTKKAPAPKPKRGVNVARGKKTVARKATPRRHAGMKGGKRASR